MILQDLKNIKLNKTIVTHKEFHLELAVNYDNMIDNQSLELNRYANNELSHISVYDKTFEKTDEDIDYDGNETYFCSLMNVDDYAQRDIVYDSFIFPYSSISDYEGQSVFVNKHGKLYVLYNDTYYIPTEVYTEKNSNNDLYWYSYINLVRIDESEIDKLTTKYICNMLS